MDSVIQWIVFFMLLWNINCQTFVLNGNVSWYKAQRTCDKQNNSSLKTLTYKDLHAVSDIKNRLIWTGLRKQKLKHWFGISSKIKDVGGQDDENCVFIDTHGIHARSCLTSDLAAICGAKECTGCDAKACIRYEEKCYFLIFGVNWFEARHKCHQMSLNLLDITTTGLVKYITEAGYSDNSYWTAYHREDWVVGDEVMEDSLWKPSAAIIDSPTTNCAVAEIWDSGIWWIPVECHEKHHFICSGESTEKWGTATPDVNSSATSTEDYTGMTKAVFALHRHRIRPVIMLSCLSLMASMVAMCGIYVCLTMSKNKTEDITADAQNTI